MQRISLGSVISPFQWDNEKWNHDVEYSTLKLREIKGAIQYMVNLTGDRKVFLYDNNFRRLAKRFDEHWLFERGYLNSHYWFFHLCYTSILPILNKKLRKTSFLSKISFMLKK